MPVAPVDSIDGGQKPGDISKASGPNDPNTNSSGNATDAAAQNFGQSLKIPTATGTSAFPSAPGWSPATDPWTLAGSQLHEKDGTWHSDRAMADMYHAIATNDQRNVESDKATIDAIGKYPLSIFDPNSQAQLSQAQTKLAAGSNRLQYDQGANARFQAIADLRRAKVDINSDQQRLNGAYAYLGSHDPLGGDPNKLPWDEIKKNYRNYQLARMELPVDAAHWQFDKDVLSGANPHQIRADKAALRKAENDSIDLYSMVTGQDRLRTRVAASALRQTAVTE
jgi:hypothetical protein